MFGCDTVTCDIVSFVDGLDCGVAITPACIPALLPCPYPSARGEMGIGNMSPLLLPEFCSVVDTMMGSPCERLLVCAWEQSPAGTLARFRFEADFSGGLEQDLLLLLLASAAPPDLVLGFSAALFAFFLAAHCLDRSTCRVALIGCQLRGRGAKFAFRTVTTDYGRGGHRMHA